MFWSRLREIGIRAAFGADRNRLLRHFMLQGMWLLLIGLLPGLAAGLAAGVGLKSLLSEMVPLGVAPAVSITAGSLSSAVLLATLIPARRAASIDPLVAIRHT